MESLIDNNFVFFLVLFLINQLWQILKLVGQYKSGWQSSTLWMLCIFSSLFIVAFTKAFPGPTEYWRLSTEKVQNVFSGLAIFCGLAIFSLGFVEKITLKKIKTLWRLPIIGALLGLYLKDYQLAAVLLLLELSIWVVLIIKREKFSYYFRTNIKSMLSLLLCMLIWISLPEKKWLLLVLFCIYYYYRVVILQTVLIRHWSYKNIR